jgi:hypothetical protein
MDNTVCCYFQAQNCGWDKPVNGVSKSVVFFVCIIK